MTIISSTTMRLAALRAEIAKEGGAGFVVPLTDEHGSEYVGDYARRLEWLTGFTGSAGTAVVLTDRAALFTDGRYALQARDEVDKALFEVCITPNADLAAWLAAHIGPEGHLLIDPWLHTRPGLEQLGDVRTRSVANLVDRIWSDRPEPSAAPAEPYPLGLAGRTSTDKRRMIADVAQDSGALSALLTGLEAVAWTFNIRGRDVPFTPVVRAFAAVGVEGEATLFLDPAKVTPELAAHLGADTALAPYDEVTAWANAAKACGGVLVDGATCPIALLDALGSAAVEGPDPTAWPRALKTPTEADGLRAAHLRDGAALVEFLHWIDTRALGEGADEISAAMHLEGLRARSNLYREPSFATISGMGANGALPHYVAKPGGAAMLRAGSLYLVDSGGQYIDGTTDVTRTIALGEPTPRMREHFTRALKGHLAIAAGRFPEGTTGGVLDPLARQYLWEAGLDYATGTGHGLGSCLSVHEGPVFIGRRGGTRPVDEPLKPGLVLTVEPGLYLEGEYGIRTENAYLVIAEAEGWMTFEPLTLAPIDRRLIDAGLLTRREREWIDAYHARVLDALADQVQGEAKEWLRAACAALPPG